MKKFPLVFLIFMAFGLKAQIWNNSFETWALDTAYFAGLSGILPMDTFPYHDPVSWTSSNALSGADTFGNKFLGYAKSERLFRQLGHPNGDRYAPSD